MIGMRWLLLVPCSLASAQQSWGQDVVTLLERNELDWSAWEVEVGDRTALLERLIGDCPSFDRIEGEAHFVDFSGDGVADLVYSGQNHYCDHETAEGTRTLLYHNSQGMLTRVAKTSGHITGAWRSGLWEPAVFLVRENGCCGDQNIQYHYLYPVRAPDGTLTYTQGLYVYSSSDTELPEVRLELPRPFRVREDESNLRASPWNDRGNLLAVYGKGATGIAVGEANGPRGRVWWFVVMDASTRPLNVRDLSFETRLSDPADPRAGGRYVGWMTAYSLDVLPQTPDSLPSPGDLMWYRD